MKDKKISLTIEKSMLLEAIKSKSTESYCQDLLKRIEAIEDDRLKTLIARAKEQKALWDELIEYALRHNKLVKQKELRDDPQYGHLWKLFRDGTQREILNYWGLFVWDKEKQAWRYVCYVMI